MSIVLENLTKRFGNQFVVDNVSLEISDGELFVLLGASGSGKSTILRMIAGLSAPTSGRILLHERDVTQLSPQERGTGFVFQNYSIFRHMNVSENIEFGLKIRKTPREERIRKRDQLLDMVGLAGLGSRQPHQLSGGQQQRVALARALAYEPDVLLLDEPFGALDVKIRAQLRRSLKEIQRRLGVTTILVTHDQEEAFELADRIGVLEGGRLLEVGAGEDLYAHPKTLFGATFLGASTVLVGRVEDSQARFGALTLPLPPESPHEEGAPVQLLFRPEQVELMAGETPPELPVVGKGEIVEENFTGPLRRLRLRLPRLAGTRQMAPALPFGEEGLLVDAVVPAEAILEGKELWVGLRGWTILQPSTPRLLVCDFGEGIAAPLSAARDLAAKLRAYLTILAVAENPDAGEKMRVKYQEVLEGEGLEHAEFHLRFGDPLEQLAIEKAELFYEMVILAAPSPSPRNRRHGRDGRHLGETTATFLRTADLPVLIVKDTRPAIQRLLICTAAGEPGKSDVRVGGRLARQLRASVTLLYVTKEAASPSSLARAHLERAAATLRALDVESELKIRQAANPSEGILAEAAAHDLVVLGNHGAYRRSRPMGNDVTMQVLSETDTFVLVVPAENA